MQKQKNRQKNQLHIKIDDFYNRQGKQNIVGKHKNNNFPQDNANQIYEQLKNQLMSLIHQWLRDEQEKFQPQLNKSQESQNKKTIRVYSSGTGHKNYELQQKISTIIKVICAYHPLFSKINFYLTETLINIGTFKLYQPGIQIQNLFYSQKNKNKCLKNLRIGIILYGKLKLSNKIQKYSHLINQNDCIAEHSIQTIVSQYTDYRDVKVKCIDEKQTAILWIKKTHYEHLLKESIKSGLKQEMRKLQSHIRMSWIRKKIKKSQNILK